MSIILVLLAAVLGCASAQTCSNESFPIDLNGKQVDGLTAFKAANDLDACRQACCDAGPSCAVWEFSEHPSKSPSGKIKCWIGKMGKIMGSGPYSSRGRTPPPTPAPPTPAPPKTAPITIDDTKGLGLRWEGVGAISGGGATTKLLMDYKPEVASDILDFLFLPNFGLNLQILKVEMGGDTDATEGAEPSHIHYKTDPGNYNRGYEW
jgi:hypothetical protein